MSTRLARLHRLLLELRRRHVYRMAGGYIVVVWLFLQVADVLLPAFMVPDWVMSMLVMLALMGLPVVIALTWIYDLTPRGVQRTSPLGRDRKNAHWSWNWRWLDYLIIAVLLTILIVILAREEVVYPSSVSTAHTASIAVLPLVDMSEDGDYQYFGDGLSVALMDVLGNIPGLQVVSRTSAFAFRGDAGDAREVARQLNVDALLEGSVRKAGEQLRITVSLVDGPSGRSLWSESFSVAGTDIFKVQDSIARAVASSFAIRQLGNLESILTPTRSQAAYEQYLEGRGHLRRAATAEEIDQAVAYFQRALEIDPEFALASAGLCHARWMMYETTLAPEQAQSAFEACELAERRDDTHVETLVALGNLYRGTGKIAESFRKLGQALVVAPNSEQVYAALGETWLAAGQLSRAESNFRTAIRLDPAHWRNLWGLARVLAEQGRFDEAAGYLGRAIELEPENPALYSSLGGIYFLQGKYLAAAELFYQSIGNQPTPQAYANAGTLYYFGGSYAQARAMFGRAVALSPGDYRYHAFLGESILSAEDGGLEAARPHFEQAIELAHATLDINPEDHLVRAAMASYLATLGDQAAARKELTRLAAIEHADMETLHAMGLTHLALGQTELARAHFEAAIETGYPRKLLHDDPRTRPLFEPQPADSVADFAQFPQPTTRQPP